MKQHRMYYDLAHLWPAISSPEEYATEAPYWRGALQAELGQGRHEILELGVGGGHLLSHLTSDFQVTAVDISPNMLANSIQLNPEGEHHVGDMRSVRLGRTFDAVIIHDAISYMLTEDDLRSTFATARVHLEQGGVFICAPDWFRETFPGTLVSHWINRKGGREVTFIEYATDPDPDDETTESLFFYIIKEEGNLRIERDHHTFGLFPLDTWLGLMTVSGFEAQKKPYPVEENKRHAYLLIGVVK